MYVKKEKNVGMFLFNFIFYLKVVFCYMYLLYIYVSELNWNKRLGI